MERWMPVVGMESEYEVSDLGRVRSVSRTVQTGSYERTAGGKIMNQFLTGKYPSVMLSKAGKKSNQLVHLLVLEAFVGPRPVGCKAMRRPGSDPLDCSLQNLRWAEHEQFNKRADPSEDEIQRSCEAIRATLSDAELEHRWQGPARRGVTIPVYSMREISEDLDSMLNSINKADQYDTRTGSTVRD